MIRQVALSIAVAVLVFGSPSGAWAGPASPVSMTRAGVERAARVRFGPAARVSWDRLRQVPRALRNLNAATAGVEGLGFGRRALDFVQSNRDLMGVPSSVELDVAEVLERSVGAIVRLGVSIEGLPVEGVRLTVTFDAERRVSAVRSDALPSSTRRPERTISAAAAASAVVERFAVVGTGSGELVVLPRAGGVGVVAWRIVAVVVPLSAHFYVWVDAESGEALESAPVSPDQSLNRLPLREAEVPR